jgi:hypothetical protein
MENKPIPVCIYQKPIKNKFYLLNNNKLVNIETKSIFLKHMAVMIYENYTGHKVY